MRTRCEWCGQEGSDWNSYDAGGRPGMGDPFKSRARKFFACSDPCVQAADRYYRAYDLQIRQWFWIQAGLILLAMISPLWGGYRVFRWAMPVSLFFCGSLFAAFPYANRFTRDADGNLKTSLKQSIWDGRLAGLTLMIMAAFFVWRCFTYPASGF